MSKESEPQFDQFGDLADYAEALALFKDRKYAQGLINELKHFKEESPYSRETEIAQENVDRELERLNPAGWEADENDLNIPVRRKRKPKDTENDFDEKVP